MGGSGIETDETVALNDPAPGIDNQAVIQGMCNAQASDVGDFINVCAQNGLIDTAQVQEYQSAINQINNVLQSNPVTFDQAFSAMNELEGVCGSMINDCRGRINQLKQSGVLPAEIAQVYEANLNQIQDGVQAAQVQVCSALLSSQLADVIDIQSSNIDATNYPTRGPLSKQEAEQLKADTLKCLQSNNPEDTKKLVNTLNNIMADGLPSDQGSLSDIMTTLMLIQLKYAMEGKKANREMSAEMAATIYQNAMKIAENTLKSGEIAYKQALVGAAMGLVGTAMQSGAIIGGNIAARQKIGKQTSNTNEKAMTSETSNQHRHSDSMQGAIIQTTTAAGQAASGLMTSIKGFVDAGAELKKTTLQGETQKLETLNRLNENTQQGIKDVAESFNSLIKMTLQMMQSLNSLANQGQSAITGNMRS